MSRATLLTLRQNDARNVVAGQTATIDIPVQGVHYATLLEFLDAADAPLTPVQIAAAVNSVRVRINGTTILDATVAFLQMLEQYYGGVDNIANANGILPIDWVRRLNGSNVERSALALGMQNVDQFVVELGIVSTAVLSKVTAFARMTGEIAELGQHRRILQFPQNFGATGTQEITDIPKEGVGVGYQALHIGLGAGALDRVTVKVNNNEIVEEVTPALNDRLLRDARRTPQAGFYHVDFARRNVLGDLLGMQNVTDFRHKLEWNAAAGAPGAFTIFAERIHGLNIANG